MLGCLVAIPLVAVFGNALPEAIDKVVGVWWTPSAPTGAEGVSEEAPRFEPLVRNSPLASVPSSLAPVWPLEEPCEPMATGPAAYDADGRRVLPASYETPVEPPPGRHPLPGTPLIPGHGDPLTPLPHGRPASTPPPDQFHLICERLKELGSTYVLLESWGDSQEQFRFYCKIAIAGNPHHTYRFEATNQDPLMAMARVLRQVEDWRAARRGN